MLLEPTFLQVHLKLFVYLLCRETKMSQPSVILATAGYDHTIRFWEAKSGRCYRTLQYPDSVSFWYSLLLFYFLCLHSFLCLSRERTSGLVNLDFAFYDIYLVWYHTLFKWIVSWSQFMLWFKLIFIMFLITWKLFLVHFYCF